jgi:hypothetical protein
MAKRHFPASNEPRFASERAQGIRGSAFRLFSDSRRTLFKALHDASWLELCNLPVSGTAVGAAGTWPCAPTTGVLAPKTEKL